LIVGSSRWTRSISAVDRYSRVRTEEFTVVGAESSAISVLGGATPHISLKMSGQIPVEAAPILGCDDWPLDLYRRCRRVVYFGRPAFATKSLPCRVGLPCSGGGNRPPASPPPSARAPRAATLPCR